MIKQLDGQTDMFDLMDGKVQPYKIRKKIRLIEAFAGVGSQAMALKQLDKLGLLQYGFEVYKVIEFDKYAIQSYNAIHNTDFPVTDIRDVTGESLHIVEKDKYDYIFFYSFPCQDISVSGKHNGMSKDSGTRSGLLWEVERILNELKAIDALPQILIMENVPSIHGNKHMHDFQLWINSLNDLGYSSYYQDLKAQEIGIPEPVAQSRTRCFMVSILGTYGYEFPTPVTLNKVMKDYLEPEVEERFYVNNPKADALIDRLVDDGTLNDEVIDRIPPSDEKNCCVIKLDKTKDRNLLYMDGERDLAYTLMARDWKGLGSQEMNGVIERNDDNGRSE